MRRRTSTERQPFSAHARSTFLCATAYHAGIGLGEAEIRLSNFGRLATITSEEKLPSDVIGQLAEQIRAAGYTYVPFAVFGEPFSKRQRCNGDLFMQLFDYV